MKNIFVLFLITILLTGCGRKENDNIKIGAILPLTGTGAEFGKCARNSYEYAINKLNKSGGINGKKILFIVEDSRGEASIGVQAFNKLVNFDNVKIIISSISGVTLALIPLVEKNNIILFTDAAHPKIVDNTKNVFRHSNVATDEAKVALAKLFHILNNNLKIGMLIINDDYGVSILNSVKKELVDSKYSNELHYQLYDNNQTNFRTIVSSLLNHNPTAIIVAGYGNSAGLSIKALREQGYKGIILTTLPFIATPSGILTAGNALLNSYYITFAFEADKAVEDFNSEYEKQYHEKPLANAVLSYSIFQIIESGLTKYGINIPKLDNYFRSLKNFKAISGQINSDSKGNMPAPLTVKLFENYPLNK